MNRNLGAFFLPPTPKMYTKKKKKKKKNELLIKLKILGMNFHFCGFYRCENSGETLTNFTQFVSYSPEFTHR